MLDGEALGLEPVEGFRARLKFFDYGVVSLALSRRFAGSWATLVEESQQYIENAANERDPKKLLTLLAGERVRAAFQICEAIREDLKNDQVQFQKGQLLELNEVVQSLAKELAEAVKKY